MLHITYQYNYFYGSSKAFAVNEDNTSSLTTIFTEAVVMTGHNQFFFLDFDHFDSIPVCQVACVDSHLRQTLPKKISLRAGFRGYTSQHSQCLP